MLPCSRIAHIERAHKPYTENLTAHVRRNALRVAEVWMDQYKSHVYMAWNVPLQVGTKDKCVSGWFMLVPRLCGCNYEFLFVFSGCVTDLLATMSRAMMEAH